MDTRPLNAKDFGAWIRRRRKAAGLTQAELALLIGAGVRFVVDLEAGKESCQLGKALSAAAALGLRIAEPAPPAGPGGSADAYDLDVPEPLP